MFNSLQLRRLLLLVSVVIVVSSFTDAASRNARTKSPARSSLSLLQQARLRSSHNQTPKTKVSGEQSETIYQIRVKRQNGKERVSLSVEDSNKPLVRRKRLAVLSDLINIFISLLQNLLSAFL